MGHSTAFFVIAILAISIQTAYILLALFGPGLRYRVSSPRVPTDSEELCRTLEVLCDSQLHRDSVIEVLTNGQVFYEAEIQAIRAARCSINLEAYIFQKGEVAGRVVEALAERARAGVKVNVLLDAVGAFSTRVRHFRNLTDAGGRVEFYHPLRWYSWPSVNNRTHRELLIIDGTTGFAGGAGFADHWLYRKGKRERWRDTMLRVEGHIVASLQSTFCENWLEASGDILMGSEYFPFERKESGSAAMVVISSPTAGGSTRARILFQTLLAAAQRRISITTPYFLPDSSVRTELKRAIRERGVQVQVIVPGTHSDHILTRHSSRRIYGGLLKAGVRIYEYQPAMIHAKILIVDGVWTVAGSTNFDYRSFGLNDEVNIAAFDRRVAERLREDFDRDLVASHEVTYDQWRRRSVFERLGEPFGWVLEREQ